MRTHSEDSGFDTLVTVQWGNNRASQKTWHKNLLAPSSTGQNQHFGYDGLYQVTERQRGLLNVNTTAVGGIPAQQENFSYDETGNWITYRQSNDGMPSIEETRVNNRSNQMTQVDGSSAGISYDANGNMLTVPTGDGLTGPSRKLVWDAWNRLRKVSDADDNVIAEYQYDGGTRRTITQSGGVTKHCYYNDQWRTVEERLDASTTPVTQHVWHPANRQELLFRDRSTANNGTLDERLYSLKDQLDPVAICDTSGSIVERFAYSAFGIPTFLDSAFVPQSSSSHSWSFLFHADFTDAETGWFNYGFRYYVPALGRWLNEDPLGEEAGLNLFAYVGNAPTTEIDELGLDINYFDPHDQPVFSGFSKIKHGPDTVIVGGHGTNRILTRGGSATVNGKPLTPEQVARDIMADPGFPQAKQVDLYACNTGNATGHPKAFGPYRNTPVKTPFAQKVADIIKKPVTAPNDFGWIGPDGTTWVGPPINPHAPPKQWKEDIAHPGARVPFYPAAPKANSGGFFGRLFGR